MRISDWSSDVCSSDLASDLQIVEDAFGSFAPFEHRGDDEVRAADHIATSEHLRVGRLELVLGQHLTVHFDATVLVQLDGVRFEPRRRARPKTDDRKSTRLNSSH